MTKEQAKMLTSFKNHCTCGGYAWRMNGRSKADPHMNYCPQREEYLDWYKALNGPEVGPIKLLIRSNQKYS